MPPIRPVWITFDCFGTLVDWNTGFTNILRPIFGDRTKDVIAAYHEFERLLEFEKPHRSYRQIVTQSLMRAADRLKLTLSETQANDLAGQWETMPLFSDAELLLDALRRMGFKLAVLTNCDEDMFEKTHRRFEKPFDLVVTAETVRDYKPSSSHFRHFWRLSSVDRRDWIHVGCSWYHDILPAREFNIPRIWLDRDATGEDPRAASIHIHSGSEVCYAVQVLRKAIQLNPLHLESWHV